eukprot:gene5763-6671_t
MSEGKTQSAEEFSWAVKNGDLVTVKTLVAATPGVLKALDSNGRSPCHWAADFNQAEMLAFFISQKAPFDLKDKYGITPLLAAVYEGHCNAAELLVKAGADVNVFGPNEQTALESAESDQMRKVLSATAFIVAQSHNVSSIYAVDVS